MLTKQITNGIEQLSDENPLKGTIFNIELGHSPIGINSQGKLEFGRQKNGTRLIEEGLIESIIQGLHIGRVLRREFNRKIHFIVSLSDLHGVTQEERLIIKNQIGNIHSPLIDIFYKYGISEKTIGEFKKGIELGSTVFQSNGTTKIRNKIGKTIDKFKKSGPEIFYENNGFILFEADVGDYHGIIIFSPECFSGDDVLKQGIPLLFGTKNENMSTQCGPTVTGIQKEILGNNKLNKIITVDNPKDPSIRTKSLRGQILLKLMYGDNSSFVTPDSTGNNSYVGPITNGKTLNFNQILKLAQDSLQKSGYENTKILGESDYLFNGNNQGNISCDLGICSLS
ncbi:MAG: hypothetical protein PHN31_00965 [Candidatus Gracilibacteria bacterium]|nr:hypothetical protein [Candidatus Gracilibacteria bacterium]